MTAGYDTIQSVMPVLTKIILISIILMAIFRKYKTDQDLMISAMFAFVIFYGFSTTVHPWYISLILIYSVFTNYRFALIWSFLVMLSYSAYAETNFAENKWFLITEYVLVGAVLVYEIIKNRKPDLLDFQFKKLLGKDND
jgi:hypothetical protein